MPHFSFLVLKQNPAQKSVQLTFYQFLIFSFSQTNQIFLSMSMMSEFKSFAMKGNLVDLAVGVVMGAAFGSVTKAFIDGLFMPLVGMIFNVGNLADAKIVLAEAVMDGAKEIKPATYLLYGSFIGAVINFIIVAFVMFMLIKSINNMKKKEEAAPAAPPAPTKDQELLMEIRDALKK